MVHDLKEQISPTQLDERAGNLTVVVNNVDAIANMKAQATLLVRGNYSNPPANGARIVAHVLSDPALYAEWFVKNKLFLSFAPNVGGPIVAINAANGKSTYSGKNALDRWLAEFSR